MHPRRAALLSAFLLLTSCLAVFAQAQESGHKRPITEKDLFRFTWIGDPQLSPDGSQIAFVRVTVNDKKDGYDTAIWTVATQSGESRPLTAGPRDTSPQWSPDGSRLAFIRTVEKDGKNQPPQVYILPFSGGEAYAITKLPKGASAPNWSPDGKKIAFNSTSNPEDLAKDRCKSEKDKSKDKNCATPEHESDVKVITRAQYRLNGAGYLDFKHPNHIWVADVPASPDQAAEPLQLTSGSYSENEINWSADGSQVYFVSNRELEPYYELPQNALYSVPASGGEISKVLEIEGTIGQVSFSRDRKRVAFIGHTSEPVRSYTKPDLYIADLTPGATARNVTANYDYDIGAGVGGDNTAPRAAGGSKPLWSADGNSIIVRVAKEGRANLERIDLASGKHTDVTTGNQAVVDYFENNNGSQLGVLISTPTQIGDLYLVAGTSLKRLTNINQKLWSELNLSEPEEIRYTSFDGKRIQGWLQKPPDYDSHKKYPLILNIHGGPHSAYGWVFDHEFQWMAAKGYIVLYPNPRGSTSYGQEFGNIIQYHYPGDDFKDLMAGVDYCIQKGYADPEKLGVTGGSGGGLLTDWVVGHTPRFKAAAAQRDISDWAGFWYDADFTLFHPTWFHKAPWEDPQDFVARSPITYIQNVTTPMMFILGEADFRTPPATGGEQMFRALKYLHRTAVMVRFPGESHELSRSGQPWHRIERLEHIVNWMDIYLQGKKIAGYEIDPTQPLTAGVE
ncbi:MAG TPA: S9 family peptidase [Terriglobales bacterium]|nr:S9 family peptidase [Terriglobales bacterium]